MYRCVMYHLQEEHLITCSKPSASYSIVVYITMVMPQNIKYTNFYRLAVCFYSD